jgi:nicotinamidase-related amidase
MHQIDLPDWVIERGKLMNHFPSIEPQRTAVLVVDLQNWFMAQGQAMANPNARDIVPNVNRITAALRQAGASIIWLRHSATTTGPRAMAPWQMEENALVALSITALSPGAEAHALYPELTVAPEDLIIDKYRYSCFAENSSDIKAELVSRGIDTLIITGTLTNVCCECSARDGAMLGYKILFMADATAALTDAEHNATLMNLRVGFADVMATDALLAMAAAK